MSGSRSRSRLPWVLLIVGGALLVGAACGDDQDAGPAPARPELATTTLPGSGATFPQSYYEAAIAEFQSIELGVALTYAGGGSARGRRDLQAGLVQWAGTDTTVEPAVASQLPDPLLYFPTVAAPITVPYHLRRVGRLQLSPDTLGRIFSGEITRWDDGAIAAENPRANLPATAITVVHRDDGSGTTAAFTRFLTLAAPTTWTLGTGESVAWPAGQRAAASNAEVARIVRRTDGAIGYVDLADAKTSGLDVAAIRNAAGGFVRPTLTATAAALAAAPVNANLTYDPLNAPGLRAYPITAPTYILVATDQPDAAAGRALQGFLEYIYGPGQRLARQVDFARLPAPLLRLARAQVDAITVAGS